MNLRLERIERLLHELEYEITRGMMEGEIEEEMGFIFNVPRSKKIPGGVVHVRFESRPMHHTSVLLERPTLKVVK